MIVQIDSAELNKLKRECAEAKDELRKIEETVYYNPNWGSPELQDRISRVEDALGFKLYCWQKTYIANGEFRRYGETTAKILKELLDIEGAPIDYRRPTGSALERMYRDELLEIKEKLDAAGIKTRNVLLTNKYKNLNITISTKEKIENCVNEVLKKQFPNCYVTCICDRTAKELDVRIEGFKNNKLCELRRCFVMNVFSIETSLVMILNILTDEWMDIE